jgi:hypothetical protein
MRNIIVLEADKKGKVGGSGPLISFDVIKITLPEYLPRIRVDPINPRIDLLENEEASGYPNDVS